MICTNLSAPSGSNSVSAFSTSRVTTLVVLMLGLLCLLGWIILRVPGPFFDSTGAEVTSPHRAVSATRRRVQEAYGKLRLYFVENRGQLDARVAYYM